VTPYASGAFALVIMLLAAAQAHEWSAGKDAIRESDIALSRGEVREATVAARRAAEAVAPLSPYAARGHEQLEVIARTAETEGRLDDAAFAWRAMRSAAVATRPAKDSQMRVEEADHGILRVASARATRMILSGGGVPDAPEAVLLNELANGEPPSPWLLSAIGWAALVLLAGLTHRLWRGATREPWASSP
jgi:hypothetical protein